MKKIFLIAATFISLTASAQTDSTSLPITVLLPVKAIVLYGSYLSQNPNWADRKAPDQIATLIGSGTLPDSLVTVTLTAGKLSSLITNLFGDRYGVFMTVNRSIFNNSPSIPGYTALTTQVSSIASGNGAQKAAATYVVNRYNAYNQTMTNLFSQYYANGLSWIRN